MQYILLGLISIPFLWLNYKIILSDIKIKKIPNKLLMYLLFILPIYYLYIFLYFDINYLTLLIQIIITFIICFIIYSFGLWGAGDAKYLLTLGLFIPHIGIFIFIGNIALIIILYLIIYFIWFYLGRCLFNWTYSKNLYGNIYTNLKDKFINYLKDKNGKLVKKTIYVKILQWLLIFLVVFVSIRIIRLFLVNELITNGGKYDFIQKYLSEYLFYIFITFIIIVIGVFYIIKKIYNILSNKIAERFNKVKITIDLYCTLILLIFLISFLFYEYMIDPIFIKITLYRIFTIMLLILFIFLTLFYLYKVAFQIAESDYRNIKELKIGEVVDREYLIENFGTQSLIGYCPKNTEEKIKKQREKLLLYPNPKKYFSKLRGPIDNDELIIIKKVYEIINKNGNKNNIIKTIRTFSLGGYIFLGFLITFIFKNEIFNFIIQNIKSFYNF